MKKLISFMVLAMTIMVAAAQMPSTPIVNWTFNVKMTSKTEGIVVMKAKIAKTWHLYGLDIPEGGPNATVINFNGSTGVKLVGKIGATPAATTVDDKDWGMKLSWWENEVTLTQKFKVTDKKKAVINGSVTYMTCSGAQCQPPTTKSFKLPVK